MKLSNLIALNFLKKQKKNPEGVETKKKNSEQVNLVLKRNKKSALIKCWKCGKEIWVKQGSPCFTRGLCSKCIRIVK